MKITWKDLYFLPSDDALSALRKAWDWLLPQPFDPVMASTLGDVFFQQGGSDVYWLNTGTAEITQVATSRAEFMELLRTKKADEWFMPNLVEQLKVAGKFLGPDGCYTYVSLPIFSEGKYEVANLNPVPAVEHFSITGDIHRQIRHLPDGSKVRIKCT
ncbi:MAG: T6SS immunity protein Tdi1 domain-containing protein [Pyrinomonadaceae bacterium]